MDTEQKKGAEVAAPSEFAGKKVLIIDDDEFLLNMYALKYKKGGFLVQTATGPEAALTLLREGYVPDLMLVDVIMPTMDGLELLEKVKKDHLAEDAVKIVLTNQSQQTDIDRAKSIGVHGYIVKASTIPSEVVAETEKILKEISK